MEVKEINKINNKESDNLRIVMTNNYLKLMGEYKVKVKIKKKRYNK